MSDKTKVKLHHIYNVPMSFSNSFVFILFIFLSVSSICCKVSTTDLSLDLVEICSLVSITILSFSCRARKPDNKK